MEDQSSILKVISEKLVKPSSPTPESSRYYKFCLFDLYVGDFGTPLAFFYPKGSFHGRDASRSELFDLLETSLSKTLTYYYPFAGKFMDDNVTVDCNDSGVQVWEVQVQALMSEILDNRAHYYPWNLVLLPELSSSNFHVKIQLNYFECGGICVVMSISHKLGDASTMANFINDWALIARGSQEFLTSPPVFSAASIFPPPNYYPNNISMEESNDLVCQRFVFSSSSIFELKQKVIKESNIKNPTQNEVITGLIFKSAMSIAGRLNSLPFKPSSLLQIANIRSLTIPPLQEKMVGNLVNTFSTIVTKEKEMTISSIVTEMRKSRERYVNAHTSCIEGNEFLNKLQRFYEEDERRLKGNCFDMYISSNCSRILFHEADFGFGKPIFVCRLGKLYKRIILLMGSSRNNEIDVFIALKRDQMSLLERDKELLVFASVNPRICSPRL